MATTPKLTTGRQLGQLRARIKRKIQRAREKALKLRSNYDLPAVTDAQLKQALDEYAKLFAEVETFVATTDERYNKRHGGLGK